MAHGAAKRDALLEDMPLRLDIWQRELDLSVDPSWSDESGV